MGQIGTIGLDEARLSHYKIINPGVISPGQDLTSPVRSCIAKNGLDQTYIIIIIIMFRSYI